MDIILSSGFLAFASHIGFLRAIEEEGSTVDAICGTSSGALVGALWAAGMSTKEIEQELFSRPPLVHLRPNLFFWKGIFSLHKLRARMSQLLPQKFSDLSRPMGIGVCTSDWKHHMITSGSLVDMVVASCSIPYLFAPTVVDGIAYCDGGAADRIGAKSWRSLRSNQSCMVHLVERSRGVNKEEGLDGCRIVRSPRSGASFWSFGDTNMRIERTRRNTEEVLLRKG